MVQLSNTPPNVFPFSPHWDCETQCLYFIDLFANNSSPNVFRYDPKYNKFYEAFVDVPGNVGFIIPIHKKRNYFLIGIDRCVYEAFWNGYSSTVKTISKYVCVERNPRFDGNYFGIAKADPMKRIVGGVVLQQLCNPNYPADASLYTIDESSDVKRNFNTMRVPTGLDWNTCKNKFYHNSMCNFTTKEYDWDPQTGKLCK